MAIIKHSRQIDAIAWALFFIWVGVALLADIGWAWSLLGIGTIILGTQTVVYLNRKSADVFWLTCGTALLVSAGCLIFGLTWPLVPVLLLLLGIWMFASALFGGAPA